MNEYFATVAGVNRYCTHTLFDVAFLPVGKTNFWHHSCVCCPYGPRGSSKVCQEDIGGYPWADSLVEEPILQKKLKSKARRSES